MQAACGKKNPTEGAIMSDRDIERRLSLLKSRAIAGRISRRRFIEGAIALGATTPVALS